MTDKTDGQGLFATLPGIGAALLPQFFCLICWSAYTALLGSLGVGFAAAVLIGVGKCIVAADWAVYSGAGLLFLASLYSTWPKKTIRGAACETINAKLSETAGNDDAGRLDETSIGALVLKRELSAKLKTLLKQPSPEGEGWVRGNKNEIIPCF